MDNQGKFFIGHTPQPEAGEDIGKPVLYNPSDMTTHAVVVGMTGSGKTGLCIGLLEEAALHGLPAIMVDPKGDITNTLLHFPNLAPEDFAPWVNPDQARREGKSVEELAAETAALWRKGLAAQGMGSERLKALEESAEFTVYTPGSDAGFPISILASLKAPEFTSEGSKELLREKISATVTALLSLVGFRDIDPVRSREHILLSNIFEHSWSEGHDLDLGELIMQTQSPPFQKLGVFDVNTFFPEKDRFGLAMNLNNILAAPAFQSWIEGHPLDIPSLLYTSEGRPRHSVFYLAHLGEAERMFFVTLLFSAVESWMRTQTGTTRLRSILYFDEIFGYLPPVANPPSKQILLRMLKQARAFGVGLLLATQNPVDLDYKALSNTGSWFIGKLQTDQDKQRLLDGLQGAAEGNINRMEYDQLISSLGKRVFLLHNVHASGPQLFRTRWAMNYLAGPLTRAQIPALNRLRRQASGMPEIAAGAARQPLDEFQAIPVPTPGSGVQKPEPGEERKTELPGSSTRPALPQGVREYFLPNNLSLSQAFKAAGRAYPQDARPLGLLYRPVLLAQASIRFLNRKYNLDLLQEKAARIPQPDRRGMVRWENYLMPPVDPLLLDDGPDPQARFASLEAPFNEPRILKEMQKDFLDWCFRTGQVSVQANEAVKLYAGPDVTHGEFSRMNTEAVSQAREAEVNQVRDKYTKKIDGLKTKLAREERELGEDETRLSQRRMEEMGTHAENVLNLFGKRSSSRRLSTSLSKRRMTEQAKAAVEESRQAIADFKRQIADLEKELEQALKDVSERWRLIESQTSEITVAPLKKDILLDYFGVAWLPNHVVQINDQIEEIPGYGDL